MTVTQKERVKQNLTAFITVSNFILLLSVVWYSAQWQEKVNSHIESKEIHQTYKDNTKNFAPRSEIEIQLSNMQKTLNEIRVQQDKLRDND
mgnify:CR=1 FL=1